MRQDHPARLTDVIVIADNCADDTAAQAASAGAAVWERDAPESPGKRQALAWAIERVWRELPQTDAVVIVDADCAASPNLCSTIAAEIARGRHAVQVPYEVSNPSESPTAGLRAAGFALKHVIRARGRARLGLSCNLFGTGMGFSATLLRRVPWPHSVTEDTELFVRLTRAGYRVAYADRACVTSADAGHGRAGGAAAAPMGVGQRAARAPRASRARCGRRWRPETSRLWEPRPSWPSPRRR